MSPSADLRLLSRRWLGVPYGSFFLRAIEWIDERRFVADFGDEPAAASAWERVRSASNGDWFPARVGFVLRARGMPYLFPRLALRNPRRWPAACARFETKH